MDAVATKGEFSIKINDKVIELPASIRHRIVFGEILVVVLDGEYSMRNVLAFDGTGKQLWQIEDSDVETRDYGYVMVNTFNGHLVAHFRGAQYSINPKTGKIYDRYWDK